MFQWMFLPTPGSFPKTWTITPAAEDHHLGNHSAAHGSHRELGSQFVWAEGGSTATVSGFRGWMAHPKMSFRWGSPGGLYTPPNLGSVPSTLKVFNHCMQEVEATSRSTPAQAVLANSEPGRWCTQRAMSRRKALVKGIGIT